MKSLIKCFKCLNTLGFVRISNIIRYHKNKKNPAQVEFCQKHHVNVPHNQHILEVDWKLWFLNPLERNEDTKSIGNLGNITSFTLSKNIIKDMKKSMTSVRSKFYQKQFLFLFCFFFGF